VITPFGALRPLRGRHPRMRTTYLMVSRTPFRRIGSSPCRAPVARSVVGEAPYAPFVFEGSRAPVFAPRPPQRSFRMSRPVFGKAPYAAFVFEGFAHRVFARRVLRRASVARPSFGKAPYAAPVFEGFAHRVPPSGAGRRFGNRLWGGRVCKPSI